jgi:GT2 family glycosyltransferase
MISVIVSTHNPLYFNKLTESIQATSGIDYEIIAIENHSQFSICDAYNQGIDRAKYEYLCFVHEDVVFKSDAWGAEIVSVLDKNENIGLIGVAGAKYKSSLPLGWHISKLREMRRGCIFQGQNSTEFVFDDFDPNEIKKEIEDVVCLDGVILFTRKKYIKKNRFDEKLLNGFHGYDTDISLQFFLSGKRVVVDRRVKIFHHSLGSFGKDKAKAEWKISRKWFWKLPAATKDMQLSRLKILQKEMAIFLWYFWYTAKRKLLIKEKVSSK